MIADYIAGKVEQSYPIQSLFQEILILFQQEAICVGPAFRNTTSTDPIKASQQSGAETKKRSSVKGPQASVPKGTKPTEGWCSAGGKATVEPIKDLPNSKAIYTGGDKPVIEGFRIVCNGRLQMSPRSKPAEKAESVVFSRGVIPFNSLDQKIDFKQTYATNAYGTIGIKVWIHYISRP